MSPELYSLVIERAPIVTSDVIFWKWTFTSDNEQVQSGMTDNLWKEAGQGKSSALSFL